MGVSSTRSAARLWATMRILISMLIAFTNTVCTGFPGVAGTSTGGPGPSDVLETGHSTGSVRGWHHPHGGRSTRSEFPAPGMNWSGGIIDVYSTSDCSGEPVYPRTHIHNCEDAIPVPWFPGRASMNVEAHLTMHCDATSGYATACGVQAPDVRLTGGNGTSGRVEVKVNGVWGTVCGDGFGTPDAVAVCRSIGLDYDASYHTDRPGRHPWNWRTRAAGPPMPIVMSFLTCNGQAGSILDCAYTANPTNCQPNKNVQVICVPPGNSSSGFGFGSDPANECLASQQSPHGSCTEVQRIGVCAPLTDTLFGRFNCGQDYGYLQQRYFEFDSDDGAPPPANRSNQCNTSAPSVQTQHRGVAFRGSDRCFVDPGDADTDGPASWFKIQGCDASSDTVVVAGMQCNADCTVCLHNASAAAWVDTTYEATHVGACHTRFVNTTHANGNGEIVSSTRRIDFTIDAFVCPGTLSPTLAPSTTPTSSQPTSVPTGATCSQCAAGTSGPCRYVGGNSSLYGTCRELSPSTGEGYDDECVVSEDDWGDNYYEAAENSCVHHVERCTEQNNRAFDAMLSFPLAIETATCSQSVYQGTGMMVSERQNSVHQLCQSCSGGGFSDIYYPLERYFPQFSSRIAVDQPGGGADAWGEASMVCQRICCENSMWCLGLYIEVLADGNAQCNLMSESTALEAAGVDLAALNCDTRVPSGSCVPENQCTKTNVGLGDGSVSGTWNFSYYGAPNRCSPDCARRRSRLSSRGDRNVRQEGPTCEPIAFHLGGREGEYTLGALSNQSVTELADLCDVDDSLGWFRIDRFIDGTNNGIREEVARKHFYTFPDHPLTSQPARLPTASPMRAPISSPTSFSDATNEVVSHVENAIAALENENSVDARLALNGVADVVATFMAAAFFDASARRRAGDAEVEQAMAEAFDQIASLLDNFTLAAAQHLNENTVSQGVSSDGSIVLTSVHTNRETPLTWPFFPLDTSAESSDCLNTTLRAAAGSTCDLLSLADGNSMSLPAAKYMAGLPSGRSAYASFVSFRSSVVRDHLDKKAGGVQVGSMVLAVSFAGATHNEAFRNNATMGFTMALVVEDQKVAANPCVWWDGAVSGWSSLGCSMVDPTTTILSSPAVLRCECNHLTSFAILMDASPSQSAGLSAQEQLDLSIFVYFCVFCSIVCLTIVIVVYLLYRELRTQSKTVLLHLCASYDIALILFIVSGMADLEGESCKVVGAALHFALLSTFLWMLMEGYMLHETFTNVFGHRRQDTSKALRWYMGTAYGLPLIEVLVAYFAWPAAYERDDGVCFLAKKNNAMWLFVGPVLVVIVLNVYALVKISRVIYGMPVVSPRDSTTAETIVKAKRAFMSALMFGSIMGITWLLGLLSFFAASELAFHYTFAVLNALGGVWIFGFHLAMDPEVKKRAQSALGRGSSTTRKRSLKRQKSGVVRRGEMPTSSSGVSRSATAGSMEPRGMQNSSYGDFSHVDFTRMGMGISSRGGFSQVDFTQTPGDFSQIEMTWGSDNGYIEVS